jgi:HEAT repeat protein
MIRFAESVRSTSLCCLALAPAIGIATPRQDPEAAHAGPDDASETCARYARALEAKQTAILLELGERLKSLGRRAEPALPSLLLALDYEPESDVRSQAFSVLQEVGPAATRALVARAIDAGLDNVVGFGPAGPDALAETLAVLDSSDELERRWIALVLDNLGTAAMDEIARRVREASGAERLHAVQAARAFAWRQGPLVATLEELVDSPDPALRYWATFSLAGALPRSLPRLLAALSHSDPRVRRAAIEGIEKSFDAIRSSASHPDVIPYEAWHGVTRDMRREIAIHRALVDSGVPKIAAALADSDSVVRIFAAMTLAKLAPKCAEARPALARAAEDPDAAVRLWAAQAMARLDAYPWPLVHAFSRSAAPDEPSTRDDLAQWIRELDHEPVWDPAEAGDGWSLAWPKEDDVRWLAATRIARTNGTRLIAEARAQDEENARKARELLDRVDDEIGEHLVKLLALMEEEFGGGPADDALRGLGAAAFDEVRFDFLRYPRFPLGDMSYDALSGCLAACGVDGRATLALGLEHWCFFARAPSADALATAGEAAAPFVANVISAWRTMSDDLRAPGTESWWDGNDRSDTVLPPGWSMTVSGDEPYELGSPDSAVRRTTASTFAARVGASALGAFVEALEDEHAIVRARAAASLKALGDGARPALAALTRRMEDPERRVRIAAAAAVLAVAPADSAEREAARRILESLEAK